MRTPGHAVINLALVARPSLGLPIVAGAVVPDLPIVALYFIEKARGTPTERIWSEAYQRPFWLNLIHGLHSMPLAAMGLAVSLGLHFAPAAAFFASMLLHAAADLPLHAEDAHRHFWPFSDWRFVSPISYWDVRRHATVVGAIEAVLVWAATARLWPTLGTVGRALTLAVCGWYAIAYWWSFARKPQPSDAPL